MMNPTHDYALLVSLPLAWVSDPIPSDAHGGAAASAATIAALATGLGQALAASGLPPTGCYAIPRIVTQYFLDVQVRPAAALTWLEPHAGELALPPDPLGVTYGEVYFGCDFQVAAAKTLPARLMPVLRACAPRLWPGAIAGVAGAVLLRGSLREPAGPAAWTQPARRLRAGGFAWCDARGGPLTPHQRAWGLLLDSGYQMARPVSLTDRGFAAGLALDGTGAAAVTVPAYADIAATYAHGAAGRLPFDLEGEVEGLRHSLRGLLAAAPAALTLTPATPALPGGQFGEWVFAQPARLADVGFDYAAFVASGGGLPGLGWAWRGAAGPRQLFLAALGDEEAKVIQHATFFCARDAAATAPDPQSLPVHVDYPLGLEVTQFCLRLEGLRAQLPCPLTPVAAYSGAAPEGFMLNHPGAVSVI